MELIRDDVRLAGYYGEFVPPAGGVSWQLPANPCDPTLANLGWNATGTNVPVAISGFEGHDAAIAALSPQCISNRVPNSDVLVVRRTSTTSSAPPPTAANTPFLQVSLQSALCTTRKRRSSFDIPHSPSSFTLHQKDCTAASLVRQYLVHIYYVSTCDDCTPNDGIPTLKRVELGAGSMATTSLAQGIADFRVEYGLDTGNDGFPDTYKKCGDDQRLHGTLHRRRLGERDDRQGLPADAQHRGDARATSTARPTRWACRARCPPSAIPKERTSTMSTRSPIRVTGQSDMRELP